MFIWTLDDVIGIVIIGSCIGYICIHSLIQAIKDFLKRRAIMRNIMFKKWAKEMQS